MKDEQYQALSEPPVPAGDHYQVVKFAEEKVKEKLKDIGYEGLLIGIRVGYYEPPPEGKVSSQKVGANPCGRRQDLGEEYKMEFGYLEALDDAEEAEITEKEWKRIVEEGRRENPLPIEFVDELYEDVKKKLEESAGYELLTGVFGVLLGSTPKCWGSGCYCRKQGKSTKRYCYYDKSKGKCVCYCTDTKC